MYLVFIRFLKTNNVSLYFLNYRTTKTTSDATEVELGPHAHNGRGSNDISAEMARLLKFQQALSPYLK